jgi:hypothetical protein
MSDDDFLNPATPVSAATGLFNTSEGWSVGSVESVRDSINHLMAEVGVLRNRDSFPSVILMLRPVYEELKRLVNERMAIKESPDGMAFPMPTVINGIQIEVFDDNMEMMRRWLELAGRGVKVKVVRVDAEKSPDVSVYNFNHRG